MDNTRKQKGFSLIEMLLSVALISAMAAFSVPMYRTIFTTNDLESATSIAAQTLRRAHVLAIASDGDNQWGVRFLAGTPNRIILFKGASYATRVTGSEETYEISSAIAIGGTTEFVFAKLSGEPNTAGSVTFTTEGTVRTVTLNAKGMVSY